MLPLSILGASVIVVCGLVFKDWLSYRRLYELVDEEDEETWTCEACGYHVSSVSLEGVLEGMRLHDQAIYCPGDEDDCEEIYD